MKKYLFYVFLSVVVNHVCGAPEFGGTVGVEGALNTGGVRVSKTRLEEETYPAAMMVQGEDMGAFFGGTYRFYNFISELGLMGHVGTSKGKIYDAQQPFAIWAIKEKRTHGLYWLFGIAVQGIRAYIKGQYARSLFEASYEAYDEEGEGACRAWRWGWGAGVGLEVCVYRCVYAGVSFVRRWYSHFVCVSNGEYPTTLKALPEMSRFAVHCKLYF